MKKNTSLLLKDSCSIYEYAVQPSPFIELKWGILVVRKWVSRSRWLLRELSRRGSVTHLVLDAPGTIIVVVHGAAPRAFIGNQSYLACNSNQGKGSHKFPYQSVNCTILHFLCFFSLEDSCKKCELIILSAPSFTKKYTSGLEQNGHYL